MPADSTMQSNPPVTTLITGATGFIGRHLVAALTTGMNGLAAPIPTKSRVIHLASTRPGRIAEAVDRDVVTTHRLDLRDAGATARLIDSIRPSELFHLAWAGGDSPNRYSDPANRDWVSITDNLISSFAASGGRRAIVAGSCIEYGPVGGVLTEGMPACPDTVYGISKLDAGRQALEVAERHDDLSVTIARIFFVMGRFEPPDRLVPHIIRRLLDGEPAELSTGTQRRDYMHAWDVASALIAIADGGLDGVVNVGTGRAISVKDLAVMIADVLGRPDLLHFGARPGGADTAAEITADITRITSATNWRPALDLPSAAADVAKWWSTHPG